MIQHTILFLVRDRALEKQLLDGLSQHYTVVVVQTRRAAMATLHNQTVALVLVDVPSLRFNLERFCQDVLALYPEERFFFLLSKGMRLDQLPRAQGYLRHTFTFAQLIRRLARTLPLDQAETIAWRGLRLDVDRDVVMWDVQQVPLTPKQSALLRAFLRSPDQLLSRAQLMQEVWGTDYIGDTRTLDVHIHWLRKSLAQLQAPFVMLTERGQGYRLMVSPEWTEQKDTPSNA